MLHGKKLGGAWSAMNKDRKLRDLIQRLYIPHTTPPQYEHNLERMVDLAKKYHDTLQQEDLLQKLEDHKE